MREMTFEHAVHAAATGSKGRNTAGAPPADRLSIPLRLAGTAPSWVIFRLEAPQLCRTSGKSWRT